MSARNRLRLMVTGASGQVGWELLRSLAPLGGVVAADRSRMDLSDPDAIRRAIRDIRPAVRVNPAAWTAIDRAEAEPDAAAAINAVAPGILAEECRRLDALRVHYSTDFVFDGSRAEPWTEDDEMAPLNVYGATKLAGERAGCIHCAATIFFGPWSASHSAAATCASSTISSARQRPPSRSPI